MKKIVFILFFVATAMPVLASHIVGGEMIYDYLNTNANGSKRYRITLRLFRDQHCTNCAGMPANVFIGVFNNDTKNEYPSNQPFTANKASESTVPISSLPPCITNTPDLLYHVADYPFIVDLPVNQAGYTAAYQTCCRTNPLDNVFNVSGNGGTGATYSCIIPGTNTLAATSNNSSPKFNLGISVICHNKPFTLNFSATDDDGSRGDSLVYSFCEAYNGGPAISASNINPAPPASPTPPQYTAVEYINGFTATTPLGNSVTINSKTGMISGTAPHDGHYVVCVCINKYRDGVLIGYHRKDFIVDVEACDFTSAQLPLTYNECHDSTFTFSNQVSVDTTQHSFFWDFGDGSTSTFSKPTHTYGDTGIYTVKLILKKGQSCTDSARSRVLVYPGFFPNFNYKGVCATKPTRFFDSTKTRYGVVSAWSWDFGDPSTFADTSHLQNPSYTYTAIGSKNVSLIVSSNKGCVGTATKPILIQDKPPLDFRFRDTLICNGDTLALHAIGNGTFSWSPNVNIINANTPDPKVFPTTTTLYFAQLDDNGCLNRDSVQVRVVDSVTLRARSDTAICLTDSIQLGGMSNGLRFEWTPASDFSNPNLLNAIATPHANSTRYLITAHIGHCSTTDAVIVKASPYPLVNAGPDTVICYRGEVMLQGVSSGTAFTWSPSASLTDANTLHPIARPRQTTAYILSVKDASGSCPKPKSDTVVVTVLPKIMAYAGRDTSVVIGQLLQLNASGGREYNWLPETDLNNPNIKNPIGKYDGSYQHIRYRVLVSDAGCADSAFVNVSIYKTVPQIFVPTAFTPNGDGKNDRVRPIAVGIQRIEYFRIYNRWGQLVFSTTTNGDGWDGKINGKDQGTDVFVWMVKAVDYLDKNYFARGTVTLIR